MSRFLLASTLATVANSAVLDITWSDCGSKHSKITDLQPTSITTGTAATLTGIGTVDEDVTAAKFTATVKEGIITVATCSGDATSDIVCKLPLGAGSITVKKVPFPLNKGQVSIAVDVETSAVLPAALEHVKIHVEATDQNGDSVVCLDATTAPAASAAGPACTADDQGKLADPKEVGDKQDECGKKALGLFGIDHDKFTSCVQSELGISSGCSECYYTVADYGFHNCKLACLTGWCKSGCLSCTKSAQDKLSTCTGFQPAVAKPCMDQDGEVVV